MFGPIEILIVLGILALGAAIVGVMALVTVLARRSGPRVSCANGHVNPLRARVCSTCGAGLPAGGGSTSAC